ncbi:hypothetical protein FRC08_000546 [Ceratobasidium sp. 394]|nr:hypothetical protein FRC08_000546 [Ceratobasidium sp. 394]
MGGNKGWELASSPTGRSIQNRASRQLIKQSSVEKARRREREGKNQNGTVVKPECQFARGVDRQIVFRNTVDSDDGTVENEEGEEQEMVRSIDWQLTGRRRWYGNSKLCTDELVADEWRQSKAKPITPERANSARGFTETDKKRMADGKQVQALTPPRAKRM